MRLGTSRSAAPVTHKSRGASACQPHLPKRRDDNEVRGASARVLPVKRLARGNFPRTARSTKIGTKSRTGTAAQRPNSLRMSSAITSGDTP